MSYDSTDNGIFIPQNGMDTVSMTATAYDGSGLAIPNAANSCSLQGQHLGISIISASGAVTAGSVVSPVLAKIKPHMVALTQMPGWAIQPWRNFFRRAC